jgi:hypothetical protein
MAVREAKNAAIAGHCAGTQKQALETIVLQSLQF